MQRTSAPNSSPVASSSAAAGAIDPFDPVPTPDQDEPLTGWRVGVGIAVSFTLAILAIGGLFGMLNLGSNGIFVSIAAWILLAVLSLEYSKRKRILRRKRKAAEKASLNKAI